MKKSGLNTAENQHTAEQSYKGDKQYTGKDNQYTAADDQYAPGGDQYDTGDDQYTAGDKQYTPEDTEYSEEYQYTWGWTERDCWGFSQDLEWLTTTSPFNTLTNHQPPLTFSSCQSLLSVGFVLEQSHWKKKKQQHRFELWNSPTWYFIILGSQVKRLQNVFIFVFIYFVFSPHETSFKCGEMMVSS